MLDEAISVLFMSLRGAVLWRRSNLPGGKEIASHTVLRSTNDICSFIYVIARSRTLATKQSPGGKEIASHTVLRSVQGSALAMTSN